MLRRGEKLFIYLFWAAKPPKIDKMICFYGNGR
jgi:hypothetical protein